MHLGIDCLQCVRMYVRTYIRLQMLMSVVKAPTTAQRSA